MEDTERFGTEISRRRFLKLATAAMGSSFLLPVLAKADNGCPKNAYGENQKYKVSVCDWMIDERQKLNAFPMARQMGLNGVEVDMGGLGKRKTFDSKLSNPKIRQEFLKEAKCLNLQISSLAMSGFYAQSFAKRPTYLLMLGNCIDTMAAMNVKVGFLPFGVPSSLAKHPELRPDIVRRLKKVAILAEKKNVIIGIESMLDAAGEARLLDEIGSPAIQSYFNFENAVQNGRDISHELETLGKERLCQIHCTDKDGVLLINDPHINMKKIKHTLDGMGWTGWLVLERSRDARDSHDRIANYGANAAYVKSIFQG